MCKSKYVVLKEMLGNREICYSLFDGKGVTEMTGKQIMDGLRKGDKIYGLKIQDDELVLDTEGFYCMNLMEHRHCNNYKPMIENEDYITSNLFYICLGVKQEDGKKLYDCISTRFERLSIVEEDFVHWLKMGIVSAGAKFNEDGAIAVALSDSDKIAKLSKIVDSKSDDKSEQKDNEKKAVEDKALNVKKTDDKKVDVKATVKVEK